MSAVVESKRATDEGLTGSSPSTVLQDGAPRADGLSELKQVQIQWTKLGMMLTKEA